MTTAAAAAKHLIRLAALDPEGERMTAMRLHKLLYYCQGWHLAWHGRPLFPDRLEAWKHGPVVPAVYAEPWGQGKQPLADPGGSDELSHDAARTVDQVWRHFCRYSACGLRGMTHREPPYLNHYHPDSNGRCSEAIPTEDMAAYFGAEFARLTGEAPGAEAEFEADAAAGRLVPLADAVKELGW